MSPAVFSQVGEALYGARWKTALASDLGVTYRTIQNWCLGVSSFPDDLVVRLRPVVRSRIEGAERARSLLWSKARG